MIMIVFWYQLTTLYGPQHWNQVLPALSAPQKNTTNFIMLKEKNRWGISQRTSVFAHSDVTAELAAAHGAECHHESSTIDDTTESVRQFKATRRLQCDRRRRLQCDRRRRMQCAVLETSKGASLLRHRWVGRRVTVDTHFGLSVCKHTHKQTSFRTFWIENEHFTSLRHRVTRNITQSRDIWRWHTETEAPRK